MKALSTAIYQKASGSQFSSLLGGRFYKLEAPEPVAYPYAIYLLVADVSDPTFTEQLEDVVMQFSIYSSNASDGEIEDIFTALKALYDDCVLTISGETFLYMSRQSANLSREEYTTAAGTTIVKHYAVEYNIMSKVG